ncbi:MAG: arginase family protein, partial [Pseudobdellovibrio sp.]
MFLPLPPEIFFTKNDLEDIRLGDLTRNTKFEDLLPHDVVILGYPDDEGIKLNGGRPGAYEAPKIIRQFLYKMTPSYKKTVFNKKIHDYGDLITATHDLASRHEHVRNHVFKCLNQKVKTISFGGGHDYGYADAAAFLDYYKDTHPLKPIIINFDAHMDVRPPKNGPNRGTPFYRLY